VGEDDAPADVRRPEIPYTLGTEMLKNLVKFGVLSIR